MSPSSAPPLRTRDASVTSDYFSDSGEPSLSPSLIKDHEFVLNFDLVDEESQSSRTESRATSRLATHQQHDARLPLEESAQDAEERFLQLVVAAAGENVAPAEEGELSRYPQANLSAKQDFLSLVPETRLCYTKSISGFSSSLLHTPLPSPQHPLSTHPSLPPRPHTDSSLFLTSHGAKSCRGDLPAAPWHLSRRSLDAPSSGKLVDDARYTTMDVDKGEERALRVPGSAASN